MPAAAAAAGAPFAAMYLPGPKSVALAYGNADQRAGSSSGRLFSVGEPHDEAALRPSRSSIVSMKPVIGAIDDARQHRRLDARACGERRPQTREASRKRDQRRQRREALPASDGDGGRTAPRQRAAPTKPGRLGLEEQEDARPKADREPGKQPPLVDLGGQIARQPAVASPSTFQASGTGRAPAAQRSAPPERTVRTHLALAGSAIGSA